MRVLSLDLATTSGWAFRDSKGNIDGGVWDLKPKRGSSQGMKLVKLRSLLEDFINTVAGVDMIVYEKPAGRFIQGVIGVAELVGVVKVFCEDNEIEYTSYRPTEVKKWATGKGNSNKATMVAEAKKRFPTKNILDDNMADALLMLQCALEDYSL